MLRSVTRILIVACGCLAIAAQAAQAGPTGLAHRDGGWVATTTQAAAVHTHPAIPRSHRGRVVVTAQVKATQSRRVGHRDGAFAYPAMSDQTSSLRGDGSLRVAQQPPVSVDVTTSTGFSYTDAAVGAVIAGGLVFVGMVALRRPRPRVTA